MSRPPKDIAAYEAADGYQSIQAIAKGHAPDDVLQLVKDSGLKGFRTMINSGKEGGQEVFHIHFHIYGGSEKLAKL
jgi:hypothetical protein